MKTITNLICLLSTLLILSSCGHDFYVPDQGNLLILQEKKDFKASISYNHAQLAYSPANRIGLKLSSSFNSNSTSNSSNQTGNRKLLMGTLGVGYYGSKVVKPLFANKKRITSHPQLCSVGIEIYANASLGKINSVGQQSTGLFSPNVTSSFRIFESNLFRPFIGSQVYWQSSTFTLNFGARVGSISYLNGSGFGAYTENDLIIATDLVESSSLLLVEYDLQIAKGNDRLQTFMQVSWNNNFSEFSSPQASFSFGLKANIPKLVNSMKRIKS